MTDPMSQAAYPPQPYGPQPYGAAPTRDKTAVMGRRIAAWVLDVLIYLGLMIALFAVFAEYKEIPDSIGSADPCELISSSNPSGAVGSCLDVSEIPIDGFEDRVWVTSEAENAWQTLASFGYFAFFVVLQGVTGGSPGKLLTGLRVVDEHGERPGVGRSLIRTLLWVVDAAPWFVPLVGFIVGLTSTGHRRIGDMAAKTYVVAAEDRGAPVRAHQASAPPGSQAWAAPTPAWQDPVRQSPAGSPVDPSVPESVVPEISGVPGDTPAPPSTAGVSAPPEWDDPAGGAGEPPPAQQPGEDRIDLPTAESTTPLDEAAPDVPVDPEWWSGPEATPTPEAPHPSEGAGVEDRSGPDHDPSPGPLAGEEWAPPTTPNADFDTAENTSPTAGPAPFVAPGTDPRQESPRSPQATPTPPPQWDQARNTYIQWDPNQQMWLQWDTVANRWKIIDT